MANRQAFLHPIGAGKFSPSKLPGNILWLDSRQAFVTTNGARSFNGTNQRLVSLGSSPFKPDGNSFWLSCWFYNNASQNNANRGLINKWGSSSLEEYLVKINTSNIVQWFIKDQDLSAHFVTSQNQVVVGRWHFLFTYWDADNRKLGMYFSEDQAYQEVAADSMEQVNPAGTLAFKIGLSTANGEFFDGDICQVALGIVPATTVFAEVRNDILETMYNSGNPFSVAALTPAQLAAWGSERTRWELNERSGDALSAYDGSTNNLQDDGAVGEASGPPNGLAINTNAKNIFFNQASSPDSNLVPRILPDLSPQSNDGVLIGSTEPSRRYVPYTPNGSYLARLTNSGSEAQDATMTGFTDVTTARTKDTPKGTYDPTSPDTSGQKRHLTVYGGERTPDGFQFQGVSGFYGTRLTDPFNDVGATEWCIEFESDIESDDFDGLNCIAFDTCNGNPEGNLGFYFAFRDNGGEDGIRIGISTSVTTAYYQGTWNNVMAGLTGKHTYRATYDGTKIRLFIDGIEETGVSWQKTDSGDFAPGDTPLMIGRRNNNDDLYMPAGTHIDTIRFYSDVSATTLIAEWLFSEATYRTQGGDLALRFDGVDDYAEFMQDDFAIDDSQGFVEIWMKADAADATLYCSADNASITYYMLFSLQATGEIALQQNEGGAYNGVKGTAVVHDGQWHHCVWVSTGSEWKLYVDGRPDIVQILQAPNDGQWYADTPRRKAVTVGCLARSSRAGFFKGQISRVAQYSTVPTDEEVYDLYKNGTQPSAPILEYTFDNPADGPRSLANVGDWSGQFNGSDDEVQTDYNLDDTADYSVTFWMRAPSPGASYGTICGDKTAAGHGFVVFWGNTPITSGNDWIVFWPVASTDQRAGVQVPQLANTWAHIACTFNAASDEARLYINGELVDTYTTTVTPTNAAPPVYIGTNQSSYVDSHYNGQLDDFRIYTRELSPGEVSGLAGGTDPSASGLVMHHSNAEGPDLTGDVKVTAGSVNDCWNWNGQHQQVHSSDMIDGSGNGVNMPPGATAAWRTSRYTKTGQLSHEQRDILQYTATAPVPGLDINGDVSFACWIKIDLGFVSGGWAGIQYFGVGTPYSNAMNGLNLVSTGGGTANQGARQPRAVYGDGSVNVLADFPLWSAIGSDWVHLAVTVNKSTNEMIIYQDGVAVGSPSDISTVGPVTGTNIPYSIGYGGVSNRPRHWWQDQSLLYNRALSPTEVAALAAGGAPPASGLLAHHAADFDLVGDVATPAWALQGNNSNQHRVTVPAGPIVPVNAFEVSLEYKRDGTGTSQYLLANGGESSATQGILIWVSDLNEMSTWVSIFGVGRWTTTWAAKGVGLWAALRITFDGTTLLVYQDGDLVATGTLDTGATLGQPQNDLAIANGISSLTRGFDGQIRNLVVKNGQGNLLATWPLADGPNLPQVLQPTDATQDEQWAGDPLQTWALQGGKDAPTTLTHPSMALTKTVQATTDVSRMTGVNNGLMTQKSGGQATDIGFNLIYHSSDKISALFADGAATQLQVYSASVSGKTYVDAAVKLEALDSYLYADSEKVPCGIAGVVAPTVFRLIDFYTAASFGTMANGHVRQVRLYDYELLDEDIHTPQPYPMHEYLLDEGPSGNTIVDGTPVNTWRDRSPANNNAVQFGVTNRLTWYEGGGQPYLLSDGLDDFMNTIADLVGGSEFTWFLVATPVGLSSTLAMISQGNFNSNGNEVFSNTSNLTAGLRGTGGNPAAIVYKAPGSSLKAVHQHYGSSPNRLARWNEDTVVSSAVVWGTINAAPLYIASRTGPSIHSNTAFYEIICYNNRLPDENIQEVLEYLLGKHQI